MRAIIITAIFLFSFVSLASSSKTLALGAGIDIIQAKNVKTLSVIGNDCGNTNILVYNSKGEIVGASPVFDGPTLVWQLSTLGWKGNYLVVVEAEEGACGTSKMVSF